MNLIIRIVLLNHGRVRIKNLDTLFEAVLSFYKTLQAKSLAFAQTARFFGGDQEQRIRVSRKAMNTFFCSTDRRFQFVGRINQDVNTYTWYQSLGHLFFSHQ